MRDRCQVGTQQKPARRKRKLTPKVLAIRVVIGLGILVVGTWWLVPEILQNALKTSVKQDFHDMMRRGEVVGAGKSSNPDEMMQVVRQLNPDNAVAQIAVSHSMVGDALVRVKAHRPVAIVRLKDLYYVSDRGDILSPVQMSDALDLPLISAEDLPDHPDARSEFSQERIREGLRLLRQLAQVDVSQDRVSELFYRNDFGWVVQMTRPKITLVLGWQDMSLKLERLIRILAKLEKSQAWINVIDLDLGSRAVVRFKQEVRQHG